VCGHAVFTEEHRSRGHGPSLRQQTSGVVRSLGDRRQAARAGRCSSRWLPARSSRPRFWSKRRLEDGSYGNLERARELRDRRQRQVLLATFGALKPPYRYAESFGELLLGLASVPPQLGDSPADALEEALRSYGLHPRTGARRRGLQTRCYRLVISSTASCVGAFGVAWLGIDPAARPPDADGVTAGSPHEERGSANERRW
jgi:hypothetical protein